MRQSFEHGATLRPLLGTETPVTVDQMLHAGDYRALAALISYNHGPLVDKNTDLENTMQQSPGRRDVDLRNYLTQRGIEHVKIGVFDGDGDPARQISEPR